MTPFEETLKKYLDTFHGQEGYFLNDIRNLEFFKANPLNHTEDIVRAKISSISDPGLNNSNATEDMISHILKLNIDARIKQGDLKLVEDIAGIDIAGKSYNFLHFASLYCCLHRPNIYPIYSEEHFEFYRRYIRNFNLSLDPERLNTYPIFCAALTDLLKRLKLTGTMDYLHIRKFGWLYADKVLKETIPPA